MKNALLLLAISLLTMVTGAKADVIINEMEFPDDAFRSYLLAQDYGYDGILTDSEIAGITTLDLQNKGIKNLRGLHYFTALKDLRIYCNKINELEMEYVVRALPKQSGATLYAYYLGHSNERNYMSYLQFNNLQSKGWTALYYLYDGSNEYLLPMNIYAPSIVVAYLTPQFFPDDNFRNYLIEYCYGKDFEGLGYITTGDVQHITDLEVSRKGIGSLKGIEYFTELRGLWCNYNQLTALDLSNNTALYRLECFENQLATLNVTNCPELTKLSCSINQLTALDVTKNTALKTLWCSDNLLTSLDISKCTELEELGCDYNELETLNVSKSPALKDLSCGSNMLTALDVSMCMALEEFWCDNNQLTTLNLSNNTHLQFLYCQSNQLTSLDVTNCHELLQLMFYDNAVTEINLKNSPELEELSCYGNRLTILNLENNRALRKLTCFENRIKGQAMDNLIANLPQNNSGEYFPFYVFLPGTDEGNICTRQQVAAAKQRGWEPMGYSFSSAHWEPFEGSDPIGEGDIVINEQNFPNENFRNYLFAQDYGKDGVITVAEMTGITTLDLQNKGIKNLRGIKYFTALTTLRIYCNEISELEMEHIVRELPKQSNATLYAYYLAHSNESNYMNFLQVNNLQSKGWTAYYYFYDGSNEYLMPMAALAFSPTIVAVYLTPEYFPDDNFRNYLIERYYGKDFTGLGYLTTVDIKDWQISVTDMGIKSLKGIEYFTALQELFCSQNSLTTLDLSKNTALKKLWVYSNQLTALNLTNNKALEQLVLYKNNIKGSNMDALIASLPINNSGKPYPFYVVYHATEDDNICTKAQVAAAIKRGWQPVWRHGTTTEYYEGSDQIGDVNADGNVNSADVQKVYALMAQGATGVNHPEADVNGDGNVNSADIQKIYAIMANKKAKSKE